MFLPLGGHLLFQNKETVPPLASACCFLQGWGWAGGGRGLSSPHPFSAVFPRLQRPGSSRPAPHHLRVRSPRPRCGSGEMGRAGPAHLITNVAGHLHKPRPGILLAGPAEGDVIGALED